MAALKSFLSSNRGPLGIAAATLIVAVVAASYLIGLGPVFTVALFLAVVAAAVGIYRLREKAPIAWTRPLQRRRLLTSALFGTLLVGAAIQAVPLGRDHSNPPITGEPAWDVPETRALAVRACFDCHSNEVEYPWYSQIAPVSWAVESHIDSGRSKVNYSEWDQPQEEADKSAETVTENKMPPAFFTRFTHAEARLTESERRQLIQGLTATFGGEEGD